MGKIGGDTGGVDDIVQGELVDMRASLQQKRERLYKTISPISPGKEKRVEAEGKLTWPMPPEAPRTTARVSYLGFCRGEPNQLWGTHQP